MSVLPAVLVGLAAGVLSGMFGIGGGLITTPAIRLVLGYPALIAVGTPLLTIVPTALAGAVSYARAGVADVRRGAAIGAWGFAGSVVGALASRVVGGEAIMVATAALIAWVAWDMFSRRDEDEAREAEPGVGSGGSDNSAIGLAAGFYSGLLGLGGGFVVVPMLLRRGVRPKVAIGTSLVAISLLALPGIATHSLLGHIDWRLGLLLALGSVPGAVVGARLTRAAHDRTVRVGFTLVLAVTAVWLAASEIADLVR